MYMLDMNDTRPTRAGAPPLEPGRAETQTAGSFPPRPALTWVAGGYWVGEHLALFEPPHPAPRRAAAPRAARRARRVPVPAAAPWRRRGGAPWAAWRRCARRAGLKCPSFCTLCPRILV